MDTTSRQLFEKACAVIPGGVNSPVRACHNVDSQPLFIAEAHGCRITDVDGHEYVDFVLSWGPMILGHDEPSVTQAVCEAAKRGTSYGAPCPAEVTLAEEVVAAMPSLEMVRMVNSGTEATMSALRLARAATKRDKVLKFVGCYHGHADPFLAAAGSGLATFSIPGTPGVPAAVVADTLLAPYNDLDAVKAIFEQHGASIAAIIVEPVAANMAFQMVDDALDFAPESVTGKPTGGDVREGKLTPPLRLYRDSLSTAERSAFDAAFCAGLMTETDAASIAESIRQAGHDDAVRRQADEFLDAARQALETLPDRPERELMRQMADYGRDRKK